MASGLEPRAKYIIYFKNVSDKNLKRYVGEDKSAYITRYIKGSKTTKVYCPNINGITGVDYEDEFEVANSTINKIEDIINTSPTKYHKRKKFFQLTEKTFDLKDFEDVEEEDVDTN